jgi:hypothetical protein
MNKNQPPVINQTHPLANQFMTWADSEDKDPNDLTSPEPPKTPATPSEQVLDLTVEPANSPESTAVSPQDDMTFDQHRIIETETKRPSITLTPDGSNALKPNKQVSTQPAEETGYLTLAQMAEEQHAKVEQTQQQQKRTAGAEGKQAKKRLSSMFREARPEHGQDKEPKKTRCAIS